MLIKASLKDNGYEVVSNIISNTLVEFINVEFDLLMKADKALTKSKNDYYRGDGQVEKSFSWYSSFMTEALLVLLEKKASEVFGVPLYPTYSYARMYYNGAIMKKHTDRPACQYSCTINFSIIGKKWPIFFEDKNGKKIKVILNPGDACFYSGMELPHWRNKFTGEKMLQVFLHYVEANKKNKPLKYDMREELGLPAAIK